MSSMSDSCPTQPVTANDHDEGNIRIPSRNSAPTKLLFPQEKAIVKVVLKGTPVTCSWDPRYGPDQERSGRLRIGRRLLEQLVGIGEILYVSRDRDGTFTLR